jgi:hypothetical protein
MPVLIDGREMQPPEPLERTLAALEEVGEGGEGGEVVLLLFCQPRPLLAILQRDGHSWQESILPDGTHEIRIRRR